MKILVKAITLFICIFSTSIFTDAYGNSGELYSLENLNTFDNSIGKDSTVNVLTEWPTCPDVKSSDLIILDENTYLLQWKAAESSKLEYKIRIIDGERIIQEERNNTGVFIFQLDQVLSKEHVAVEITSICYYDLDKEPLESDTYLSSWEELFKRSKQFCDAYQDLINEDYLESFFLFGTKLPNDVNYTFDICQGDECYEYNHDISIIIT